MPLDKFWFDGFEEDFHRSDIIAISFATHKRFYAMIPQKLLIIVRTLKRAAIRMMNAPSRWRFAMPPPCPRHGLPSSVSCSYRPLFR